MKKALSVLLSLVFVFCAAACGVNTDNTKINILASFYPMYIFTKNLTAGIDEVEISNMTEQNVGCLHDYQLLAKDMKALGSCKAFVINGAGMEGFMQKAMEQIPELNVIEASKGIEIIENEHHEHDGESEHDHSGEDGNSHVWLDVSNAVTEVKNISAGLQSTFPEYAEKIAENEKAYTQRLVALNDEISSSLSELKGAKIISFHEAYEYFAKAYGLEILASIETDDGAEPTTKELTALVSLIKENSVKALFVEPTYKGNSANILSQETGARIYTLNPITSGDDSLTAYEDIMRQNTQTIRQALGVN